MASMLVYAKKVLPFFASYWSSENLLFEAKCEKMAFMALIGGDRHCLIYLT